MDYDIVVAGLGCAGLSFVYYLLNSPLRHQKILLIDNDPKQKNDRTWCYWAEQPLEIHPKSEPLIFWENINLSNAGYSVNKPLGHLKYYKIKSSDFYKSILNKIRKQKNITWMQDSVRDIPIMDGKPVVETEKNGTITGKKIFNSILFPNHLSQKPLTQVFLGWEIESEIPCFDFNSVTLMDFINDNTSETAFVYLLPFSETRGLVEYTLFTKKTNIDFALLESKLKNYIENKLKTNGYRIVAQEKGAIPMTTQSLNNQNNHPDVISLGTLAGCTKPSTGYTFHNIQKHSNRVVKSLVEDASPKQYKWLRKNRFKFYDNILLNIACKWPDELPLLFQDLFQKNEARDILQFLNEETTFLKELSLLGRLRFKIFIKSLCNYETH